MTFVNHKIILGRGFINRYPATTLDVACRSLQFQIGSEWMGVGQRKNLLNLFETRHFRLELHFNHSVKKYSLIGLCLMTYRQYFSHIPVAQVFSNNWNLKVVFILLYIFYSLFYKPTCKHRKSRWIAFYIALIV